MFETLFAKTFFILGIQLAITFMSSVFVLNHFKKMYLNGASGITAKQNKKGETDLDIDWNIVKPYFWAVLILDIVVFIALLIFQANLEIAMILFSIWSIITGIEVALVLLATDENLGSRVLGITASVTFIVAIIGIYSGIDFAFLESILFFALLILIVLNTIRLFIKMERAKERVISFFGVAIFTLYLLFDFNRMETLEKLGRNEWSTAMHMAINIYLDIINLFFELLDAMSNSKKFIAMVADKF